MSEEEQGHMASREPSPTTCAATRVPARAAGGLTAGPWRLHQTHVGYAVFGPEGSSFNPSHSPRTICEVRSQGGGDGQARINALAITCLPDLIAALTQIARLGTDLSGDFSRSSQQAEIARAALLRARGEA